MKKYDQGVLYVATGDQYIEEATFSASILKKIMSEIPTCLITDEAVAHPIFDQVITIGKPTDVKRFKIDAMSRSPFTKTIFLDTDCYVCKDISELFDALKSYDIAATWGSSLANLHPDMPDYLYGYNTGVIAFRDDALCNKFFDDWLTIYERYRTIPITESNKQILDGDQPAFHEAVLTSRAKILTLPNTYNFRDLKKGILYQPVKILHLRPTYREEFEAIENMINQTPGWPKIFVGWDMIVRYKRDDYVVAGNILNAVLGRSYYRIVILKGSIRHVWRVVIRKIGRSLVTQKVRSDRKKYHADK